MSKWNQSRGGILNRYLLILRRLIFESSVLDGRASFAAAPAAPEIRPLLSASATSIISFSCFTSIPLNGPGRTDFEGGSLFSHVSSTENVSASQRITARSTTFCSSRTFPGQIYLSNTFERFPVNGFELLSSPFPEAINEVFDQQRNVRDSFSQWRHLDRYDIEPVQEIFAKFALRYERVQITMRCCEHPHVNRNRPDFLRRVRFHVLAAHAIVRFGFRGAGRRPRPEKLSRRSPIQNARFAAALRR